MSVDLSTRGLRQAAPQLLKGHPEPYRTLREHTLSILDAAMQAVMPDHLLETALDPEGRLTVDEVTYELGDGTGVHVLVAGKASRGFAQVAHRRLPEARGLVIDQEPGSVEDWDWYVADHPVPGKGSRLAGEAAREFVEGVGPDETLLVLISGGASSLMEVPAVPMEDLAMTTQTLLARGVTVREMNTVRKHLSRIKGGRLAQACEGRLVTLALCDVPSGQGTDVGSGPTVGDPTTFAEAWSILDRVGLENFPPVVVDHVQQGIDGEVPESPTPDEDLPGSFHFLATNQTAVEAARHRCIDLGYRPTVLPGKLEGEARIQGETLAKRLVSEGDALIAGGETIVSLRPDHRGGPGLGGRNQELALAATLHLDGELVSVCSFGTDGIDGPTDAAGAIADGRTPQRGLEAKRDPKRHLQENDSYTFFAALGDLIRTGPTGTNVMDLFVGLAADEPPR